MILWEFWRADWIRVDRLGERRKSRGPSMGRALSKEEYSREEETGTVECRNLLSPLSIPSRTVSPVVPSQPECSRLAPALPEGNTTSCIGLSNQRLRPLL